MCKRLGSIPQHHQKKNKIIKRKKLKHVSLDVEAWFKHKVPA
jgi:hypothetical protein